LRVTDVEVSRFGGISYRSSLSLILFFGRKL